ncbi:MAG: prolyl aminopeptidase [Rhodospirillales bacterium]
MDVTERNPLYPPVEPYKSGYLDTGDGHEVYWECCGNAEAPAVIFLHGGPGAGCATAHRRLFDPARWNIVLFDQRGCGKSTPNASTDNNTTQHLIADMEGIRETLGIENWLIFGGSWGSTLGLVYGIAHPGRCTGFVLRGVFLGTMTEVNWFLHGMGRFFPDAAARFFDYLDPDEREDPLGAYHARLWSDNSAEQRRAADQWGSYEAACARLRPVQGGGGGGSLALARLETHYFVNQMFLPDGYILGNIGAIANLPAVIVQGRYDVICPPATAAALAARWPGAELQLIDDAGHSAFEIPILQALVSATDAMAR